MSPSMRSMLADLWRLLRAAAPVGKRIRRKPGQLRTVHPLPILQRDRACFSPHIPRCSRLTRSVRAVVAGLAAEAVAVQAGAVRAEERVAGPEAEPAVEVGQAEPGVQGAVREALAERRGQAGETAE